MLWVEGQMSSYNAQKFSNDALSQQHRTNQFFSGKDLKEITIIHYTLNSTLTHVDGDKVDLGVAMLTRFRGGHVNDFARPPFDDNVPAIGKWLIQHRDYEGARALLAESRALTPASQRI